MRPIHVLPFGPRSGPDHRIGASRCGCDPIAAEVIGEGPSGPVVWIHRPIHELAESRVQSERLDPAAGSASARSDEFPETLPRTSEATEWSVAGPGKEATPGGIPHRPRLPGPLASVETANDGDRIALTDPFCALEDRS